MQTLIRVVLPAPFGPTSAVTLPGAMVMSTASSAIFLLKRLLSPCAARAAAAPRRSSRRKAPSPGLITNEKRLYRSARAACPCPLQRGVLALRLHHDRHFRRHAAGVGGFHHGVPAGGQD